MRKYLIGVVILGVCLAAILGRADAGADVGQFLRIGAGARASGMGEAFCAVSDDTYAIYYNPAGLCQLTQEQISLMHNKWLRDLRYESLLYAKPHKLGVSGASITYLGMDSLKGRDKDSRPIGDFGAKDFAIQFSSSSMFDHNGALGISLKYIQQEIENEEDSALAFDMGILYCDPLKNIKWGMAIQNIGTTLRFINKREALPLIYRGGMSYKASDNNLLLAADITRPADNDWRLNLGLEYLVTSTLTLRCGYTSKHDLDNGFSFGAGFNFPLCQLDYAYVPYGDLGDTHRFSISFQSLEDSDKDGIHDGIDRCPNTPVGATVDSRGCPLDSDKDGVYDGLDQCPDTPEGAKVDDKGCPIDSDNDGVYDGLDQCPDTPEGAKVDAKGCPVVEAGEQWTLKELSFEHNKATLIPQSYAGLNEAAKILEQHMEVKIEIEGHSDNSGTPECNRKISQQRAEAVMEYLVSKGITAERMKAIGYGALRPVADNDTEEGQAKNRRVEFKILEKE